MNAKLCSLENSRFCHASKCFNSDCQQEISVSALLNLQLESILFYYKPLTGKQNSGTLAYVHNTMNSTKLKSSLNKMSWMKLLIVFGIQRAGCKEEHEEWHRATVAEDERWFALTRSYSRSFDNQVSDNYWHETQDWIGIVSLAAPRFEG